MRTVLASHTHTPPSTHTPPHTHEQLGPAVLLFVTAAVAAVAARPESRPTFSRPKAVGDVPCVLSRVCSRRRRKLSRNMAGRQLRLGLIQMAVHEDKLENVKKAVSLIKKAVDNGSSLVVLPECFNSPYGLKYFPKYAESVPEGNTAKAMSAAAKENGVYLIAGSIPEEDNGKLYNTCTVWGPTGNLLCTHRKVHLFDIDIPGGIRFKESEVLKPGSKLTSFNMGDWKVGLGICYDIRFGEMAKLYAKAGCNLLVYPGAFNMTTGPLHWELLQKCRAVDNELYVTAVSPAQDTSADYVAYGHTMAVDPWGKVVSAAGFGEEIVYADIDLSVVEKMRQQIPLVSQRRTDIYDTISKD